VIARARAILEGLEGTGALPAGGKARPARERPQLDLFAARPPEVHPAIEALRAVDVERMTPLEALSLVARLSGLAKRDAT
jgi:DNA mismatch repair protein MutS